MKVLFNTYTLAFQTPGGGEVIMEKLAFYLRELGVDVEFFDPFKSKVHECDVIHHFSTIDHHLWSYFKDLKKPLVVTPTHWPRIESRHLLKKKMKNILKKNIFKGQFESSLDYNLKYPDLILPTTNLEKDRLCLAYDVDPNKLRVLPNGFDFKESSLLNFSDPNHQLVQTLPDQYFLFVGMFSEVKNLIGLLEVFSKGNHNLVVVGDKRLNDVQYYESCMKFKSENIFFLGRIEDKKVLSSLYYNAKATLIPSQFETFSLVGLESIMNRTPIFITKNGATKEVFPEAATFIDPHHLSELMTQLDGYEKASITDKTVQAYTKKYSWQNIAATLYKYYQELCPK
ncbi:MAG: glycosyltransferase [Bacteriovoracaceae bacterium]